MAPISDNTFAVLDFTLSWQSAEALHEERFLARKVNPWRDLFPPGFREALEGLGPGGSARMDYEPGEALPSRDASLLASVPAALPVPPVVAGRMVTLERGRFYPRGLFHSLPGVFPQDARPARVLDASEDRIVLDLNHPMAGRAFTLEARVAEVAAKASDTGGRLSCWIEEICDFGPGMQVRVADGRPTCFAGEGGFSRLDESPDTLFHAAPRLVAHMDKTASAHLRDIYAASLGPESTVLDLMSSVHSHLPDGLALDVTGLGLNAEEMRANQALARHVVQDLNANPTLPFADHSFDAATLSLSIEYLARPGAVLREARRVLKPGGQLMVGFSNRWFPTKTVALWLDLHEFERMGFVLDLFLQDGGFTSLWTKSVRNWWRPAEDPHVGKTWTSDPVYVVGGQKA